MLLEIVCGVLAGSAAMGIKYIAEDPNDSYGGVAAGTWQAYAAAAILVLGWPVVCPILIVRDWFELRRVRRLCASKHVVENKGSGQ